MELNNQKIIFLKQLMANQSWQPVQSSNGITVEKQMLEGSDIACFKAVGIVNAKAEDLIKYVWNIYDTKENVKTFDPDIIEYTVVGDVGDANDRSRVCRQLNKLPWPMWPRESVYLQLMGSDDDMSYIIMYSVECDEVPKQPDHYVRSNVNISAYVFEPCESCTMVYRIAHVEPGGSIPSSLVNGYATKTTGVIQHLMSIYD